MPTNDDCLLIHGGHAAFGRLACPLSRTMTGRRSMEGTWSTKTIR